MRTRGVRRTAAVAVAGVAGLLVGLFPAPASADANFDGEWWLSKLNVTQAWSLTRGAGVKVALMDSGVDGTHPDLRGAVVGGTDVSGKGSPDGLTPEAAGNGGATTDPADPGSGAQHGTSMAAFIAGRGHGVRNADGIVGVAPEASLLSISDVGANDTPEQATQAVHWAVEHGAKVINMSFEGGGPSKSDIAYAEQHDMVVVAGAGNDGTGGGVGQPANFFGVVAVSGVDADLSLDPTSTYGGVINGAGQADGGGVAVAGPDSTGPGGFGAGFPSATTVVQGTYAKTFGTSNATAVVSGIIALIRAKFPSLDAANVINRLIRTATQPSGGASHNDQVGFGVPNVYKALTADVPSVCENPLGSEATGSTGVWQSMIDNKTYTPKCDSSSPSSGSSDGQSSPGSASTPAASKSSSSPFSPAVLTVIVVVLLVLAAVLVVLLRRRGSRGNPHGPAVGWS